MDAFTPLIWTLAMTVALTGGMVKGAVGFALPLVMISGLSTIMDPRLALAGLILPVVATNAVQVFRTGLAPAGQAVRLHWRYVVTVMVAIFVAAQFVTSIPRQAFLLVLGVPVVILSAIQLIGWRPTVPPRRRNAAEWGLGTLAGALGGLAGTWGPPTVLYLLAIGTPKDRQMVVQGVIYGLGSIPLVLGHLRSGILNAETALFSASMLPASLVGLLIGLALRDRLDADRVRRITLIVLVVAGLNLIRRGLLSG